jgi:hypothetical protein
MPDQSRTQIQKTDANETSSFGARSRFHTEMQTGYKSILDMIYFYQCITAEDEKTKYRASLWNALFTLPSREGGILGGATSSTTTAGGA